MHCLGIIPARYASTRFPGKPLVNIKGKTMIERVYEQAKKALDVVYVATDDERIATHVINFGGKVVLTSDQHKTGTDRCSEAIRKIQLDYPTFVFDIIINIQGDEPFIQPEQIRLIKSCFESAEVDIATLAKQITVEEELFNPNVVKVIRNIDNYAIYFSRATIPYLRNHAQSEWLKNYSYFKHIGMYAYKTSILKQLAILQPSPLEQAESLEQNRWIENGFKIYVQQTQLETIAIDTPEDLNKIDGLF